MIEKKKLNNLKTIAKYVRTSALDAIMNADNGHIGGNMSSVINVKVKPDRNVKVKS